MDEKRYYIPRYLDEPLRVIIFTLDELMALVLPYLLGLVLFDAPLLGLGMGGAAVYGLKRLKGNQGHRFLWYCVYWHTPGWMQLRYTPASHYRTWVG